MTLDGTVIEFKNGKSVTLNNSALDPNTAYITAGFTAPDGETYYASFYIEEFNGEPEYIVSIGEEQFSFDCNYREATFSENLGWLSENISYRWDNGFHFIKIDLELIFDGEDNQNNSLFLNNIMERIVSIIDYISEEISKFINYYSIF